jgi:hypothetical protein
MECMDGLAIILQTAGMPGQEWIIDLLCKCENEMEFHNPTNLQIPIHP